MRNITLASLINSGGVRLLFILKRAPAIYSTQEEAEITGDCVAMHFIKCSLYLFFSLTTSTRVAKCRQMLEILDSSEESSFATADTNFRIRIAFIASNDNVSPACR